MNRSQRRNILTDLVDKRVLTEQGKDWLVAALDPFHDFSHPIAGYPDTDAAQTVVSCYNYQTTVVKPAAVVGNWDCHVFNTPLMQRSSMYAASEDAAWSTLTQPATGRNLLFGPLTIFSEASGNQLVPLAAASATEAIQCLPASTTTEISGGDSRVIGIGFEIHNTTAEMYKQGSIITYRTPQASRHFTEYFTNNGGTRMALTSGQRYSMPPGTVAEASRLKSSISWAAKDGAYANCFQSEVSNPITRLSPSAVLFSSPNSPGISDTWISYHADVGAGTVRSPYPSKTMPFDTTGVMLTGLSAETTLLVKMKVYVERSPTWIDTDLAPLASPSAAYDINALQLYAHAVNMLPCAVKVNENAAGDWFKSVLDVMRTVAGPVTEIVGSFVPGAGRIGNAIQTALGQIDARKGISAQVVANAVATQAGKLAGKVARAAAKTAPKKGKKTKTSKAVALRK